MVVWQYVKNIGIIASSRSRERIVELLAQEMKSSRTVELFAILHLYIDIACNELVLVGCPSVSSIELLDKGPQSKSLVRMDQLDESYRERLATLLRAMYAAKGIKNDDIPCQIEEGLYLGSIGAAYNRSALKSLNITHILTVASSMPPSYPNEFKYKIVDVQDRRDINISQYFDDCFGFIDEAKEMGGCVLVHCFVGRSRSVTIVIAYLMKKHGMSCSEALKHVKSKRPIAFPNPGFLLQLQTFEKSLRGPYTESSSAVRN